MVGRLESFVFLTFLAGIPMISWDTLAQSCWLNNPFSPFVKVELFAERDELKLRLRNDFQKPVKLTEISLSLEGEPAVWQLLDGPVDLPPADRHYLDLGRDFRSYFENQAKWQQKIIKVRLSLEPTPPGQPEKCSFRITFENHRYTVSPSADDTNP